MLQKCENIFTHQIFLFSTHVKERQHLDLRHTHAAAMVTRKLHSRLRKMQFRTNQCNLNLPRKMFYIHFWPPFAYFAIYKLENKGLLLTVVLVISDSEIERKYDPTYSIQSIQWRSNSKPIPKTDNRNNLYVEKRKTQKSKLLQFVTLETICHFQHISHIVL